MIVKTIGCFGLTEPDAGSDPGSMKTVAKKVDGGYKLSCGVPVQIRSPGLGVYQEFR